MGTVGDIYWLRYQYRQYRLYGDNDDVIAMAKRVPLVDFQRLVPGYSNEDSPFYHWYLTLRGGS